MNPLQRLVQNELKALGIKRSELVKRMGFGNVNKGLRRLDNLMETLDQHDRLLPLLQRALYLPDDKLQAAVTKLQEQSIAVDRTAFSPIIQVIPIRRPSPVFVAALVPSLLNIQVPENLSSLPVYKELSIVCDLYRKHREKHEGWSKGKGVIYHRSYDESFELDKDCFLVKHNKCHIGVTMTSFSIGGVPVRWRLR